MTFGDVRRSGELDLLRDLLDQHGGASPEQYVAAIEASADRRVLGGDLAVRLDLLRDVDFDGDDVPTDDYEFLPGDDVDFREDQVAWDEPEVRYWDVIVRASRHDLPTDLAERYCSDHEATGSPGSSGAYIGSWVDEDRLDELTAELEDRGFTVIRDSVR